MRTIVIDGSKATVTEIEDDYREFQKIVGGFIEGVGFPVAGVGAYINEEGKLDKLPYNVLATAAVKDKLFPGDYICGPMIVVGVRNGGEVSLSDEQVAAVLAVVLAGQMP